MIVGLRIDVDTHRGTRLGVPSLLSELDRRGIRATFFFSVGPDNMGRHLWRLRNPRFLAKMLRSRAPSLYGWDILLRGVFWPGPVIGRSAPQPIRDAARAGHEIGLHAWDHHAWQVGLERMSIGELESCARRGFDLLADVIGEPPACSAAPGWRCNAPALLALSRLPLRYQSDCRGRSIFLPRVEGEVVERPQIPTTLPTYDEIIGRKGITDATYNAHVLSMLAPERLNVLTIHAEVEGIAKAQLFRDFLDRAATAGARFLPLGDLLGLTDTFPVCELHSSHLAGRQGSIACQGEELASHRLPGAIAGQRFRRS